MKKNILLILLFIFTIQLSNTFCRNDHSEPNSLVEAAQECDYDECVSYIQNGSNVNETDNSGSTALHYAALFGRPNIAQLLINNNANTTIQNNAGYTALDLAQMNINPLNPNRHNTVISIINSTNN